MSTAGFDEQRRSSQRSQAGDLEEAAAYLRGLLRGGEVSEEVLGLRALAGERAAQLALGRGSPPSDLEVWVEAWIEVDRRAWVCAPLVAAGLCVRRLSSWPAGEGTARVLSVALIAAAATALEARADLGAGVFDPRRAAEQALSAAAEDMDELRQLMESIQAEHGLALLREPRALACGLAAVESTRTALRARRGLPAKVGRAVCECATALDDVDLVRSSLETCLQGAASRLERQLQGSPLQP